MITIIYIDDKAAPYAVAQFENAQDAPNEAEGQIRVLGPLTATMDEIINHWRVVNGALADVSPRPSAYHYWVADEWVLDFDKLKAQKWTEIKTARNAFEFGSFTANGLEFDSNQISQQRIGQAAQGAMFAISVGAPFTQDWTLKDNSVVTFDAQQMIGVALAMGAHVSLAHERGRMLREQLEAALTVEDVAAVTWPSAA